MTKFILKIFTAFMMYQMGCVVAFADTLKWDKWQWEEVGFLDCSVRFSTNSSECAERGKTRIIIIEAKDIPTAYNLYVKQYGKMHQKSGYALERALPMQSHSYVVLYDMPLDLGYGYTYAWSEDRSNLSIDLYLGLCKSDKHCLKANLTFIDIGKNDESMLSHSDETYNNAESNQDSMILQESKSDKDSATSQDSKTPSLSQSELDAKIISHAKKAKQAQKTKSTQNQSNKIKIIVSVW